MPVKKKTIRRARNLAETKAADVKKLSSISLIKNKIMQPKILVGIIILVVIVLLFIFKGIFVVAMVNGKPISRVEVIKELEKQGGKQTLTTIVNKVLIKQEAAKKKIQVSKDEVNKSLKQIEDSLKTQGQSLDAALTMQGMTRQDLIDQLEMRSLVEKLLADKIKVSEKEVADYIAKNKESLPTTMTGTELNKNVEEQLKQQKLSTESSAWIQNLTKNANIQYFVNY